MNRIIKTPYTEQISAQKGKVACVFLFFAVFAIFLVACSKDIPFDQEIVWQEIVIPENYDDETFVSLKNATDVAKAFFGEQTTLKSTGSEKKIVSAETVRDHSRSNFHAY